MNNQNRKVLASMLLAALAAPFASVFAQGNLMPPGAPTPTMKTLEQVEPRTPISSLPYTITNSGSYYVTGNLSAVVYGLIIEAGDVTVDLMGFTLTGDGGTADIGIHIKGSTNASLSHISIKNGTLRNFGYGLRADHVSDSRFTELRSGSNTFCGMLLSGVNGGTCNGNVVADCTISYNGYVGLLLAGSGGGCNENSISGCTINNNGSFGGLKISGSGACNGNSISDCTVSKNNGHGIQIQEGDSSSISRSSISENTSAGIFITGNGSSVNQCSVQKNKGSGVDINGTASIIGCIAYGNGGKYGIRVGADSQVKNCTASGNAGTDPFTSYGIYADTGSSILGCTASSNSNTNSAPNTWRGTGIYAGDGSSVRDCTASGNQGSGIHVTGYCYVVGNICDFNGQGGDGAGIHSTDIENRIEGNTVTYNPNGIKVEAADSLIVRNSAIESFVVNYAIAASNKVGEIVSAPGSASIYGDTGGAGVGSTDPWANFSFN
jgi:hypothetical protein